MYNSFSTKNQPVRIAIIGAGKMASLHARAVCSAVAYAELSGVYDPQTDAAQLLAERWEVPVFESFDEAIRNSDALIIASPTQEHFPQAAEAIRAGKHVLIEKPVCATPKQARELQEIASSLKTKPVIQVGHIEHFNPSVVGVLNFINGDNPLVITTKRLGPHDPRTSGTDVVSDLMLHDIHVILNIAKSPIQSITAVGIAHLESKPDYAHATIIFEDGMIAHLTASRITEEKQRSLSITSSDLHITADYSKRSVDISRCSDLVALSDDRPHYKQESVIEKLFVPLEEPLVAELRSFVGSIRHGSAVEVGLEMAVACMNIVERINEVIVIQEKSIR